MTGAPGPLLVGHTVLLPHRLKTSGIYRTDFKRPAFREACIVGVQHANILFRAASSALLCGAFLPPSKTLDMPRFGNVPRVDSQ
jgi:hypothetical protein